MNKEVELRKNTIILFIFNVIYLFLIILLKDIFAKLEYNEKLISLSFIIEVIILIIGIIFNVFLLIKKVDEKKSVIISVILFILIFLLTIFIPIIINKGYEKKFSKIGVMLSNYCSSYECDTYENVNAKNNKEFILKKKYYDYDNNANDIKIRVTYNTTKVIELKMIVYSDNESFSSEIIKNELTLFASNFNYDIDDKLIDEAFEKRFDGNVKSDNFVYEVNEVYENKILTKIKTTITVNFNK